MKKLFVSLMLILSISTYSHSKDFKNVEYVKNYDGDTITVNIHGLPDVFGKKISVRIRGIDTPEIRGKCENEKQWALVAKHAVKQLLLDAKHITLVDPDRDKYFRILADVYADEVSVGQFLIDSNLAFPYDGGKKINHWCEE